MRLLIFDFGSYTYEDVTDGLKRLGIGYRAVSYHFEDKNEDAFFEHKFTKVLKDGKYDAVFSVNYFPLVAKCCHDNNKLYISWSYDNPLNVPNIEKTLGYPTNRVFLFDKAQVYGYLNMGFENIYHMPLAVNTHRLDGLITTQEEYKRYSAEISFVGKLYESDYELFRALCNEEQRGYLDAVTNIQQNLYGAYLLDDLIDEEYIDLINGYIKFSRPSIEFELNKEALIYATAANITKRDRLVILGYLSKHHELKLYTKEFSDYLKDAICVGSCGYLDEMPKIFRNSKINLNISFKSIQTGIPLRCMDIMGAGGFLLSNYQSELDELFINGQDLVLYDSIEDAIAKTEFYLKNDELRKSIALNGYNKVKDKFSYEIQLLKILRECGIDDL